MPQPKKQLVEPEGGEVFLSVFQVRARYGGVSHMWIERRLRTDPDFPRPVKMGRLRFWKLTELQAYERLRTVRAA